MLGVLRLLIAIIIAFIAGKLISKLRLPAILGWLIVGMILGPHAVGLLDASVLDAEWYHVVESTLECAVGLMIGTELLWGKMKRAGKQIVVTTLTESVRTFLVVSVVFGVIFWIEGLPVYLAFIFAAIALAMIVVVIEVNEGQRRIPVQYAKRVIGRKMYGGHSTFLPLKVNQAGVIPIIFASSILMLPVTLAQFVHVGWVQALAKFFGWGTWANTCLYAILIVIFTYFYTAITVNVTELADNMKKYGGFIPGIRPGEPTMRYVDKVLTRITLTGSVFLAFIAILPNFIGSITNIQGVYFGGTALLIIVGVALDTMRQAQSLMVTRNYQGFIK